jgi:hypothetical protein
MKPVTIPAYNAAQSGEEKRICDMLRKEIDRHLPEAQSKIWHAHPVWFPERFQNKWTPLIRFGNATYQKFRAQVLIPSKLERL